MRVQIDTPHGPLFVEHRFAIKAPTGMFFTHIVGVKSTPVTADGKVVGHNHEYAPRFEAATADSATKFDVPEDAQNQMANPDHSPAMFAGCVVVPVA